MIFTCICGAKHNVEHTLAGCDIKIDTVELPKDFDDIQILRKLLWLKHGCSSAFLYGDDGEMQCSRCVIDFKRDSISSIEDKFNHIALRGIAK